MTELTAGDLGSSVPRRGTRFSRWLGRRLLAALGLRITGHMPNFPKMMVIGAPHTSNWDGVMAIGMALALLLLPVSSVIADRFSYYLIPIQTMIFARLPFLPFRQNAAFHAALPYVGLLLVFTVWSQLSGHFRECYIPYQTWLLGSQSVIR